MYRTNFEDEATSYRELYEAKKKKIIKWSIIGVGALIILFVFINSFTIVKPGYHGVKYAFGTVQEEEAPQGFNWHAPWVNIEQYPTSTEVEKRIIEKDEEGTITDDNTFMLNTGDGKSVKVALTYNYHYQPDMLDHVFVKFRRKSGPEIADQYIDQQIINIGQNLTTTSSVLQVYSQKRAEINAKWYDLLRENLASDGIVLEEFTIVDVIPDNKTLEILQQVADEENKRELVKRQRKTLEEDNLNIAQQNINNKLAAEGEKEVAIVKAQQKAETDKINAEAQAAVKLELAQAEAKANLEVAKSISATLIEYNKWNNWNGEWPTYMLGDDTSMFLGR